MSFAAFIMIIASAGLHASWNLIAKKSVMSIAFYTVICSFSASLWLHTQLWTPVDVWHLPLEFWLYLAGSVASDSLLYCSGLVLAYKSMEMSAAYPMMRSLPLLMTAGITALLGWGSKLTALSLTGMLIVFIGCLLMPLVKFSDMKLKNYLNRKMLFVLIVASGTTGYTIFDSQAQNVLRSLLPEMAKPVVSMTYYSTRGIFLSLTLLILTMCIKSDRALLLGFFRKRDIKPLIAGFCASLTYILVLLAMNYVTNVSFVQAFRQIGLVLGVLGGVFFLKERVTVPKITGVAMIISGLVLTVI